MLWSNSGDLFKVNFSSLPIPHVEEAKQDCLRQCLVNSKMIGKEKGTNGNKNGRAK